MFTIRYLGQDVENNKVISSGVTFGYIDQPLYFEARAEEIESALRIELNVLRDKNKKPFQLDIGAIQNNKWTINFYNPSEGGSSGPLQPFGPVIKNNRLLGFMFMIDVIPGSSTYRLIYEFYEGTIKTGE